MIRLARLGVLVWVLTPFVCGAAPSAGVHAATIMELRDLDGDGREETRVYLEGNRIVKTASDRNFDGKDDAWVQYRNGRPHKGERDRNFDGRIDTWEEYDDRGELALIRQDRYRSDGRVDYWVYLRSGRVYRREWDRNFDGKPDYRTYEDRNRFLKKEYDNDYDGKFEKTVRAPARGESGITPTTAQA